MKTHFSRFMLAGALLAGGAVATVAGGCSYVKGREIAADEGVTDGGAAQATTGEADVPGLRYYLSCPYLIIEEQADNRWAARLEVGPDPTRLFTVQPKTIMGDQTSSVTFHSDGTLKRFALIQDQTKVSEALVKAVGEVRGKELDLKKAMLEDELERLTSKSAAAGAAASSGKAGTTDADHRRAYVLRISGDKVQSQIRRPGAVGALEALGRVAAPTEPGATRAAATTISATRTDDGLLVARAGAKLGQEDVLVLVLGSAGQFTDAQLDESIRGFRARLVVTPEGKILIPSAVVADVEKKLGGRVTRVRLGLKTGWVDIK